MPHTNLQKLVCVCVVCSLVALVSGCGDTKKKDKGIIGKKTQDIGVFDPNAKQEISDSKVKADDPLLYGAQAYGPMMEQVSKLGIEHSVNLFYATEGRYPKDHDEFMQRIIKENNIQLPVLPFHAQYQYDVENHKLVVVKAPEKAPDGQAPAP